MKIQQRGSVVAAVYFTLWLMACGTGTPPPGSVTRGGECSLNAECGASLVCMDGRCEALGSVQTCTPGKTRCNGGEVEECSADGRDYDFKESCAGRCSNGACVPQLCAPNTTRCQADNKTVEACLQDGSGYAVLQTCEFGCASGVCVSPEAAICTPGQTRCLDSITAGACNASGTGFTASPCASNQTCVAGGCQASAAVICVPGRVRCNSQDVEECKPDGTGYTYLQSCTATCSSGACVGAACKPFTLHASSAALPADGSSTVLITSEVVANSDGVAVPDGTLFTVEASANTAGVLSADLDSTAQGVQVASVNGKIDFLVKTGPGASEGQSATVKATTLTASSCKAALNLPLVTPAANLLAAEDFTRATSRDASSTTATWSVERAEVAFPMVTGLGNGEDGDLYVAPGTFNINTQSNPANPSRPFPDAVAYRVTAFATNNTSVSLADFPAGLSAGDEVVLINLQGGSNYPSPSGTASGAGDTGNVGTYETFTIKAVNFSTNQLTFSSPILKIYGATNSNATLTGQKIIVQRIPHYRNVTVSGTLTANAWDGAMGGVLFAKASGALIVSPGGQIAMNGKGYRTSRVGESYPGISPSGDACGPVNGGGSAGGQNPYCYYGSGGSYGTAGSQSGARNTALGYTYGDALLTRLFMGSGGGTYVGETLYTVGGGIVVVWANTLGVSGSISADGLGYDAAVGNFYSGGSAGGSVYLRANTQNIGQARVTAKGGPGYGGGAGGAGRIRIDAISQHAGDTTSPAFTPGITLSGTVRAQTVALDNVSGAITRARIVSSVQDTRGGTVTYELSSNGGTNWKVFLPGEPLQSFDVAASDLRLRMTLTSDGSNRPLSVQGVSIEYLAP